MNVGSSTFIYHMFVCTYIHNFAYGDTALRMQSAVIKTAK